MSVQGLLQKGPKDCSKLEEAAGKILSFPRLMWEGRNIEVKTNEGNLELKDEASKSLINVLRRYKNAAYVAANPGDDLGLLILGCIYALGSIVALPCLGLGAAFKKIALNKDLRANRYHKLVEAKLILIPAQSENEKLQKEKTSIQKKIDDNVLLLGKISNPSSYREKILPLRQAVEKNQKNLTTKLENITKLIKSNNLKMQALQQKVDDQFQQFKGS